MVEIKKVVSRADMKKFIMFPFELYKDNKYKVPELIFDEWNTLRKDKNPAFEYCEAEYWLAFKDGKVAGRIAGIINSIYNRINNTKRARFGWIDFIDDMEVSKALIDAVEAWAKEKGCTDIHGPLGFCDMDRQGMMLQGYEELDMLITIYNYPYYPEHIEKHGYMKDIDWFEYEIKTPDKLPEKLEQLNQIIIKRYKLRIFQAKSSKDFLPIVPDIFELYNVAYKDLYGEVPLTDRQIAAYTKQYFSYIVPDFVRIIYDENDKIAAFGITLPSLSKAVQKAKGRLFPFGFIHILRALKKGDRLDLMLIAVRPDMQNKGLTALMLSEITKNAISKGIKYSETGPELETNDKVQALWKFFEARQHRKRRCYIKTI
ncbi:MAG: GNAT family N-acetyltransferase [Eubacteriales bacterium]|nr:GNAT family N-acetyltransferase [Eubacteriales bacterium]